MRVYDPLMKYLDESNLKTIVLTYSEIEKIIGRKLPPTAYKKYEWWSNNDKTHTQSAAWSNVGYETRDIILGEKVTFEKV